MITRRLAGHVSEALERASDEGLVHGPWDVTLERPKRREHGDWSTNVALTLPRRAGVQPRALAEAIVERLPSSELIERVEVAGPGFINFHLSAGWLHDVVRRAADRGASFGRTDGGSGTRVRMNVEFVSANPTGPINVVSGRHAAVGDTIARLLEATGAEVVREYYVNDAGRQMAQFARSVETHYLRALGRAAELPEQGYRGDYVANIGRDIAREIGEELLDVPESERLESLRAHALARMIASARDSLARFGTSFDVWTSEASLHADGSVKAAVERLRADGWLEERDGALWFLSSRFGDDKDRVIVRSDGTTTYLASDVAYMLDKFERGFDRLVYVLGADHHGTLERLRAIADASGFGRDRVEFPLVQNVTILSGGETLKASKRAGVIVLLDDLLDEVGRDAARYMFLTRSLDAPLDFDIDLAKQQASDNPVYYTQYAHARIASILRRARADGHALDPETAPLERLEHPSEDALMRKLASYEEVVPEAAALRAPQRIPRFVEELASVFSAFYRDCRVVSDDRELTAARLALCLATQRVIADGLGLLAVHAPDRM